MYSVDIVCEYNFMLRNTTFPQQTILEAKNGVK